MARWVLYGATGYTGALLAEAAAQMKVRPVLAGRSEAKLAPLADRLGLEHAAAPLGDAAGLRKLLDGAALVLHAAGPFVETSRPMIRACLETRTSYLDITGELGVFEEIYQRDAEARARGIAFIPGVGFDVVPTDCLARHVVGKVAGPSELELAVAAVSRPSAGTAKSMVGILASGGRVRREGKLVFAPLGRGLRRVRFSSRERWVAPGPLAELAATYRSTGVPNITTYLAVSSKMARALGFAWPLTVASIPAARVALRVPALKGAVDRLVERRVSGPDRGERERGRSFAWARAAGPEGAAEAWLETSEAYEFTRLAALRAVEEVLERKPRGALTPSQAFGADFALGIGATRILDRLD